MSFTPDQSRIRTDSSIEEQIAAAPTAAEIQRILREAAVNQGIVKRDIYDPNVLLEVPPGDAARAQGRVARTVTVNGQKYILEGNSERELAQGETDLYRQTFQPDAATVQARDEAGRFVEVPAERSPADRVAADLVEQSLRDQGIDPDALREFSKEKIVTGWSDAVEEFKSTVGAWWVGGQVNVLKMTDVLLQMGCADNPNVENLRRAAEYLRDNNLLAENPEAQMIDAIRDTNDPYALRTLLQGHSGIDNR